MILKVIFLFLPALAYGEIKLYLRASAQEESKVEFTGTIVDVADDKDIPAFGLDFKSLKQAIKAYSGAEPREVFLRAPTVVNGEDTENLFEKYHLKEVTRKIIPKEANLVDYKTETVNLGTNYNIQRELRKTYFGTRDLIWATNGHWINNAQLTKGEDKIYYFIEMGINNLSPMVNSSFQAPFVKNVSENIYISAKKEFVFNKGQRGEFGLRVTKRVIDFKIDYVVSLDGQVVCYYPEEINGKKVWGYDIDAIIKTAGKENVLEISEFLQVVFYSDADIYPML